MSDFKAKMLQIRLRLGRV